MGLKIRFRLLLITATCVLAARGRPAAGEMCTSLQGHVDCNEDLPLKRDSVAHCIVGGVRTLYDPQVYARMRENLIEGLGGVDSEVFIYTDLRSESSAKGSAVPLTMGQLLPALLYLESRTGNVSTELLERVREHHVSTKVLDSGKVQLATLTPPDTYPIWVHHLPGDKDAGVRCGALCTGQFDKWHRCFRQVAKRERERKSRFDWVVKSRPDLIWFFPSPPIGRVNKAGRRVYWSIDRVIYSPREDIAKIADMSRVPCNVPVSGCGMGERLGRAKSCWCLMKAHLAKYNIKLDDKRKSWKGHFRLTAEESEHWRLYSDSFKRTGEATLMLEAFGQQGIHGQTFKTAEQNLKRKALMTEGKAGTRAPEFKKTLKKFDKIRNRLNDTESVYIVSEGQ